MSLLDKLKNAFKNNDLEDDILQSFRQACWDLYITNLPDPVIIDNEKIKDKSKLPEELQKGVPRGFSISTKDWTIYFNKEDLPKNLKTEADQQQYSRSIFQHEITHFTQVPADGVTEAILLDAALKGFKDPSVLNNKDVAAAYGFFAMNIMGDLIGDTLLAKENYGREDYGNLTVWRQKETVKAAREVMETPSLIWETLVSAYEKFWKEDIGLNKLIQKRRPEADKASDELVKILDNDWKDRKTWEDKMKKFASVLESVIKKSDQESLNQMYQNQQMGKGGSGKGMGKGTGSPINLPDDIVVQMGDPTESRLNGKKNKKGLGQGQNKQGPQNKGQNQGDEEGEGTGYFDESILEAIYERNKNNPQKFAGTMSALKSISAEDALRLMYRARAKELLIKIEEKQNQRAERSPSYQTSWQIGDPLIGKGGLDVIASMMASPKPVPGLTTVKRKLEVSEGTGKLKMIPDLFIVIDSSGSMGWAPWNPDPESRGDFDKAILASEASALYAAKHGGRVAVVNHSAKGNVTKQDFTTDLNKIEKAIMVHYNGGTEVPREDIYRIIKKTKNPLLTCYMSDCEMTNPDEAVNAFGHGITEHDSVAIFKISGGGETFINKIKNRRPLIYRIKKIDDLFGIILGQVKRTYSHEKGGDENTDR